ncbi:MAG TPA: TonB-dependent receptor [Thermoanaerobaculia bacterium]|jgi:vitamin B12 transporter
MALLRTRVPAAFAAMCLGVPVLAQDAPQAPQALQTTIADHITVTAERRERPLEAVGSSVTVITAEEIEARRAVTLADLLRTVPGVEVVRSGGSGQVTSVFLRGGNSSHTLVLVDQVRVNGATTGAFDFADLTADMVERIEIVRGPQSTLYGSEAMAGVIAITTRRGRGDGPGVHGAAEAGGQDHRRLRLGLQGATPELDYSVAASRLETDAVSAASRGTEDDPHENTSAAARLGFGFAGDGRVDVSLRAFQGDVAVDGFDFVTGPVDALDRVQERDAVTGSVQATKTFGRVRQTFVLGLHDDELTGRDPVDVFSNFAIDSRAAELTAQSDVTVSEADVLTLGYSYERREGASAGNFDETVDFQSLFVQNAFSWRERFFLTAGARHDDHSDFGGETTFRVASAWKLGAATRLHGSFGTGFKAPTLVDLFFPFFGNPELAPETSQGADLGVERRFGEDVTLDVTWFTTRFDDLIVFDFVTSLPQNVAEATAEGVEVALDVRPSPRFQVAASYTLTDTEDRTTGLQLARRPQHRGVVSLFFEPAGPWRAQATLIAVADRIDSDGRVLDDYERVDVTVQYRVNEHLEPYLRVENLFDEDYEEVGGFATTGALAVVGLGVRF